MWEVIFRINEIVHAISPAAAELSNACLGAVADFQGSRCNSVHLSSLAYNFAQSDGQILRYRCAGFGGGGIYAPQGVKRSGLWPSLLAMAEILFVTGNVKPLRL